MLSIVCKVKLSSIVVAAYKLMSQSIISWRRIIRVEVCIDINFGTRWRHFSNSTLRAPYPKRRAPALVRLQVLIDLRVGLKVIHHDKYSPHREPTSTVKPVNKTVSSIIQENRILLLDLMKSILHLLPTTGICITLSWWTSQFRFERIWESAFDLYIYWFILDSVRLDSIWLVCAALGLDILRCNIC